MNPLYLAGGIAGVLTLYDASANPTNPNPLDPSVVGVSGTATGAITGADGEAAGTDPGCMVDPDTGLPMWWCKTLYVGGNFGDAVKQAARKIAGAVESLIGALIPDWVWAALAVGGVVYLVHSGVI